jgi:hypothetical protein
MQSSYILIVLVCQLHHLDSKALVCLKKTHRDVSTEKDVVVLDYAEIYAV